MKRFSLLIIILSLFWVVSDDPVYAQVTVECTVQGDFVVSGCFGGRDCIPALTNPKLVTPEEANYLRDDNLVLGVYRNGVSRAYPQPILWWHEIVNDTLGGEMFTISLCPLTGTGLLFDATLNGEEHTFGVSGLLYNNNLIMYDRQNRSSLIPQMCYLGRTRDGDNLPLNGDKLTLLPIIETTWGAWKKLHPNTLVLSDDTGYQREYARYPYGDYRVNNNFLLFPLTKTDDRLEQKDMVFGLNLNNINRAYPFEAMGNRAVLNDDVGGTKVLVLFVKSAKLAVGYYRNYNGQNLTFELDGVTSAGFIRIKDRETNTFWNILGEAISGPLAEQGAKLEQIPAYNAMWFAWGAFWDAPEIADIDAIVTAVEDNVTEPSLPTAIALHQNFPNPFNPSTTIAYDLSESRNVTITIYDVLGRQVRSLLKNARQSAGQKTVTWNGQNDAGEVVVSGVYVYRIQAGDFSESRKMIMLK